MTLFTGSLWPSGAHRPYLRLAVALIVAPLALAAVLTLLAFLAAGSTETSRAETMAVTKDAAMWFFAGLPAFTLTFGLAGVALLWALAQRGALAWLLAGAGSGAFAAAGLGLITQVGIVPKYVLIVAVLSLMLFALIRWIAGVRPD